MVIFEVESMDWKVNIRKKWYDHWMKKWITIMGKAQLKFLQIKPSNIFLQQKNIILILSVIKTHDAFNNRLHQKPYKRQYYIIFIITLFSTKDKSGHTQTTGFAQLSDASSGEWKGGALRKREMNWNWE